MYDASSLVRESFIVAGTQLLSTVVAEGATIDFGLTAITSSFHSIKRFECVVMFISMFFFFVKYCMKLLFLVVDIKSGSHL